MFVKYNGKACCCHLYVAGALAASGIGKYIPRYGIPRISSLGHVLQVAAWLMACMFGDSYAGLMVAIVLVDIGAQ